MRPSMPLIPKSGANTARTIAVAKAIGRATSCAAARATRHGGSPRASLRRCSTFSTRMIAASTSRPTAIARPPSVIVLSPTPSRAEEDARQRDRERQRERHDRRAAQIAEPGEQHERDEHRAERDGAADAADRVADELGLVVDLAQIHARRERGPDRCERGADARRRLDGVCAELLADAAAHHLAAQPVRHARGAPRAPRARRRRRRAAPASRRAARPPCRAGPRACARAPSRAPSTRSARARRSRPPRSRRPPRPRGAPRRASRRAPSCAPGRAGPGTGAGSRPASRPRRRPVRRAAVRAPRTRRGRGASSGRPRPAPPRA